MIIDADSHYFPHDIFDQLVQKEWVNYYHQQQELSSLDVYWANAYLSIKDPTWPESNFISEFGSLPLAIRTEIAEHHTIPGLNISKDLSRIFLNYSMNLYPRLQDRGQLSLQDLKLDRQLLNSQGPLPNFTHLVDDQLLKDIACVYNNTMLQICRQYPEYDATAWLPMVDPEFDIELLRTIISQEFFGINLGESENWGNNPYLFEIFSLCASNRFPAYLHLSMADRTVYKQFSTSSSDKYQIMKKQWPESSQTWRIGIMELITENIIDRLPDLRIVIAERGLSWIPELRNFMLSQGWTDPLPYFKNNFWFTIEVEETNFIENARLVGWDRLLFATDYPHNDPGGLNQYRDVDMLIQLLKEKKLTQIEFDAVTYKNYELLKHRN
jgi:predicted TIM-barrel fold metal-dependent hydrolase